MMIDQSKLNKDFKFKEILLKEQVDISTPITAQIYDNFLPLNIFIPLKNLLLSQGFPWYYKTDIIHPKKRVPSPFFLPFNLSLEIEGMSGMRLFEKFRITDDILPPSYEKNSVESKIISILQSFNEVDFLKNEVYQLQESLQGSYKRIKILNETINEQRDKIFQLEGRDQLEFKF